MKKYDSEILSFYLKKILSSRVYEIAKESPLEYAPLMSQKLKAKIYLKREDQQETFSFKIRGAYNKIANLTEMQLERGIICASAGNHAQGVSLAAKKLGTKATIVMPKTTPEVKVEAVKKLGAFIILVGDSYSEAYEKAWEISLKKKLTFIHPFDDDEVIAAQTSSTPTVTISSTTCLDNLKVFTPTCFTAVPSENKPTFFNIILFPAARDLFMASESSI